MKLRVPDNLELSESYLQGITWFINNINKKKQNYTPKIPGTKFNLVSAGGGIYKPKDSEYALSCLQTLGEYYSDKEAYTFSNDSCLYLYHERFDKNNNKEYYQNLALNKNMRDRVPVGIIIKTHGGKKSEYTIKVGLIIGWLEHYYLICCANDNLELDDDIFNLCEEDLFYFALKYNDNSPEIQTMLNIIDERKRTTVSIVQRQGQGYFRKKLLNKFDKKCCITGTEVESVLDAAHIIPYFGAKSNNLSNGLLLRSDIHVLWDLHQFYIDPESKEVIIYEMLLNTEYKIYNKQIVKSLDKTYNETLEVHKINCRNKNKFIP